MAHGLLLAQRIGDDPPLHFSLRLGLLSEYGFQYRRDRGALLLAGA